jgi:hypothetical protein
VKAARAFKSRSGGFQTAEIGAIWKSPFFVEAFGDGAGDALGEGAGDAFTLAFASSNNCFSSGKIDPCCAASMYSCAASV